MGLDTANAAQTETSVNPFAAVSSSAVERGDGAGAIEARTFVTFELAGQWIAVDVANVREILDRQVVTPLPRAPSDVSGVIDVRGASVVVVDLPSKLGFPPSEETPDTRFLVFEFDNASDGSKPIAVKAEKVLEVSQIANEDIEAAPEDTSAWDKDLIRGITRKDGRLVVVIDFARVFEAQTGLGEDIFDFETSD